MWPAVRFVAERIEIAVEPGVIEVDGLYEYRNPWPVPLAQGFRYPVPVDAQHPEPESVEVLDESAEEPGLVDTFRFFGSRHYAIRVPARGTARVRVRYRQRARDLSASYILLTTRSWRRPLERAEYELKPRGVRIVGSNYTLDGHGRHSFVKESFMPDRDWRFSWRVL